MIPYTFLYALCFKLKWNVLINFNNLIKRANLNGINVQLNDKLHEFLKSFLFDCFTLEPFTSLWVDSQLNLILLFCICSKLYEKNTARNVQYSRKCFLCSIIHFHSFHPKYWTDESPCLLSCTNTLQSQTYILSIHIQLCLYVSPNNKHLFLVPYWNKHWN